MPLSPRIRKLAFGLALLLLLFSTLPSLAARLVLEQQLRLLGASTVQVRVFHLNLWTGRLTLRGLRADRPGRPWLRVGELVADIGYSELLQRRLHLTTLRLHDTVLPVTESDGRWQLGPLELPLPPAPNANDGEQPTHWRWGLSGLDLVSLELDLRYGDAHHHLSLDELQLPTLHQWAPEELSRLRASGSLNGSRFALDGSSTPLSQTPRADTRIQITDLALGPLLALWQPGQKAFVSIDASAQFSRREDNSLQMATEGQIQIRDLAVQQAALDATAEAIAWQGRSSLALGHDGLRDANMSGQLRASALGIKLTSGATASAPLSLTTSLELDLEMQVTAEEARLALIQTSDLGVTNLRFQQPGTELTVEALHWQGQTRQQLANNALTGIHSDGDLSLTRLNLAQPERSVVLPELTLKGQLSSDIQTALAFDGSLALQDSSVNQGHLKIASTQQQWNGQLALNLTAPALTRLAGDYLLHGLNLSVTNSDANLSLKEAGLKGFTLDTDYRLSTDELSLEALAVADSQPLLNLDRLELQQLSAGAEQTRIDSAQVGGLTAHLILDEDSQPVNWNTWVTQLRGPSAATQAVDGQAEPAADETTPYPFKLGQLSLTAPLRLSVLDQRVKAGRPMSLTLDRLALAQLDTRSAAATSFDLAGQLNRFGQLSAKGEYRLFAEQPSGQWVVSIAQLELPPFSPYMNLHTGYQIASGQMKLDSRGTLNQGELNSSQQIQLNRFEVERGEENAASEFNGRLGMPLELAVSILTDEDNNVVLDIPVEGSLSDPTFGIQSVVNILLGKIAKEGAMGYLSFALQPYGALLSLGKMALDAMEGSSIALEAVEFEPGSGQLTPAGQDYLTKLSGLLQQRPGLRLKLCGYAVAADSAFLTALAQQSASAAGSSVSQTLTAEQHAVWLYNLAEARGDEVKAQLQANAVPGERLFSCLPKSTPDDTAAPRVQLGL